MRIHRVLVAAVLAATLSPVLSAVPAGAAPGSQNKAFTPTNTAVAKDGVRLGPTGAASVEGMYNPHQPYRVLDTRNGNGAPRVGPIGPGGITRVQVAGRGPVPNTGVSAVVLNVTVTDPTAWSYLTVYPAGVPQPTASSLNFYPGWTGANSVTVPVGTNGMIDVFNHVGSVNVIADVVGFYAAFDPPGAPLNKPGEYFPIIPERMLDTRTSTGGGALPGGWRLTLPVDFGPEANANVRALAVTVTAVDPGGYGYLTTWNGVSELPETSTLNFAPNTIVPNLAIIETAPCQVDPSCAGMPQIGIYNGSGADVHLVVDLVGVYDNGTITEGLRYRPISPTRIVDSRSGQGLPAALGQFTTGTVTTPAPIATPQLAGLVLNVTAVAPTAWTFLTVWPAGYEDVPQPTASNLNPRPGQIVSNGVLTEVGPTKQFNIFNHVGDTHVVVDVTGAFEPAAGASARSATPRHNGTGRSTYRHAG